MLIRRRFVVLLSCLLSPCLLPLGAVHAQQSLPISPSSASPSLEPGKNSQNIHLDVVVSSKDGKPVAGLTQQDFTLLDNKTQQPIQFFRAVAGSQSPVAVVIVIDTINMTAPTVSFTRQEIDKFFHANNGKLACPTQFVIVTDTGTQILPGFTQDGLRLSAVLDQSSISLRDIRQSSGFYGAAERLEVSIHALQQLAAHEAPIGARKIILWMSPGWPLLGGAGVQVSEKQRKMIFNTIQSLSEQLREARITLYSIDPEGTSDFGLRTTYYQNFLKGVRKAEDADYPDLALQVLAVQSGGQALHTNNDVTGMLQKAIDDTSAWYELSFTPTAGEPEEYHQLEVRMAKAGLTARTRAGYYSPAP